MKEFMYILGVLSGLVVGYLWGIGDTQKVLLSEAVKRGAAEWVVKDDGRTEFKWKEKP